MSEWGISPLEIEERWTNRMFWMFGERLTERLKRKIGKSGSKMTFNQFVDHARGKR